MVICFSTSNYLVQLTLFGMITFQLQAAIIHFIAFSMYSVDTYNVQRLLLDSVNLETRASYIKGLFLYHYNELKLR